MSLARTRRGPRPGCAVAWGSVRLGVAATLLAGALVTGVSRADGAVAARVAAVQVQLAQQGWLQLDQDQRDARHQAGPMTPAESRALQTREQQESMQLRQTLDAQRQERDALERSRRRRLDHYGAPRAPDTRSYGVQMNQSRERQSLRLRQDLNRRIEGTPPGRPGLR